VVYGTQIGDTKVQPFVWPTSPFRVVSPFKGIEWSVNPGERWGVSGSNGAGRNQLSGCNHRRLLQTDEGRSPCAQQVPS
jgi:ABC-type polysaccharide/polyol phosphate transport system ATPase subunit